MRRMVLVAVLGILFFFAFASLVTFLRYLYPPRIASAVTPADIGLPAEEVAFSSADTVMLKGWFIPRQGEADGPAKTIVVLHGWPADKGNVLPGAAFLADSYNLFLFDFRGLGESGGRYSTFGARETEDLKAALSYLESRGEEPSGVWGFSMGAAAALMAAPELPIVADSSYARLDWLIAEAFRLPLLRHPLAFSTRLWGMLVFGIDARDVAPAEAASAITAPVLLIHAEQDAVIPFSHALHLREALRQNAQAEFWFREQAFHGSIGPEYENRVEQFFQKHLQ